MGEPQNGRLSREGMKFKLSETSANNECVCVQGFIFSLKVFFTPHWHLRKLQSSFL